MRRVLCKWMPHFFTPEQIRNFTVSWQCASWHRSHWGEFLNACAIAIVTRLRCTPDLPPPLRLAAFSQTHVSIEEQIRYRLSWRERDARSLGKMIWGLRLKIYLFTAYDARCTILSISIGSLITICRWMKVRRVFSKFVEWSVIWTSI